MMKKPFDILLIGGASGVGKSCLSNELSKELDMNVVLVDDFQCIVEHFTREEDYPAFHFWTKHFDKAISSSVEEKLESMIAYGNTLSKALALVVENHLEENRPMILEGDFISPDLCKALIQHPKYGERIKCIFITEDDQSQIESNYLARENCIQVDRSHLSWHYNLWLKNEANGSGILTVPSRPWNTLLERVMIEILDSIGG